MEGRGCRGPSPSDPRTGKPVDNGIDAVTIVEREAWFAEVLSKAVFVARPDAGEALLARSGGAGVILQDGGRVHALGTLRTGRRELVAAPTGGMPE